ncbi:hypothetical protein B0T10DRAFT_502706, partial [Thelonectria olida]
LDLSADVCTEARLMHQQREAFIDHRHRQIDEYASQRKNGKRIKPSGEFITSVSIEDIRQQHEEITKATEEARAQLRSGRSLIISEQARLKTIWREARDSPNNSLGK